MGMLKLYSASFRDIEHQNMVEMDILFHRGDYGKKKKCNIFYRKRIGSMNKTVTLLKGRDQTDCRRVSIKWML